MQGQSEIKWTKSHTLPNKIIFTSQQYRKHCLTQNSATTILTLQTSKPSSAKIEKKSLMVEVSQLSCSRRSDLESQDFELLWVEVFLQQSPRTQYPLLIGCCYRPPNSPMHFYEKLETTLDNVVTKNILLLGDFNANHQEWCSRDLTHHGNALMIADLRAFRQDNLSFRKDANNITFFPTAGPASRAKLGIHVGIHTVVKRQYWLGGQLRMSSFCRQMVTLLRDGCLVSVPVNFFLWKAQHHSLQSGKCRYLLLTESEDPKPPMPKSPLFRHHYRTRNWTFYENRFLVSS